MVESLIILVSTMFLGAFLKLAIDSLARLERIERDIVDIKTRILASQSPHQHR